MPKIKLDYEVVWPKQILNDIESVKNHPYKTKAFWFVLAEFLAQSPIYIAHYGDYLYSSLGKADTPTYQQIVDDALGVKKHYLVFE